LTRILIIEDDPAICACLEGDLRLEGYEVEVRRDGPSGARRAKERPFDLILLDVMLPGMDGFDVCRDLRRSGLRSPVLILTARDEEVEKILGLELGADDYVTKPFSPRELRARIRALLRRGGLNEDIPACRLGGAIVDFNRFEIRRGGESAELTPIEARLLAALVRARGRVLTRQQLLNEAWGDGVVMNDRAVDNHMTRLRRKIEPDPSAPRYIVSVRGVGYRIDGSVDGGIDTETIHA